jgi:hypothetical protein
MAMERPWHNAENTSDHLRPRSGSWTDINRTDDTGGVDDDVLLIGVGYGALTAGDVVLEEDEWQKRAREIERPVIAL